MRANAFVEVTCDAGDANAGEALQRDEVGWAIDGFKNITEDDVAADDRVARVVAEHVFVKLILQE